jgi:hypothetical protein
MSIWNQVNRVLRSRKFWALLAALTAVAAGLSAGKIDVWQAVQAAIAALAVYSTGVAIEDAGRAPVKPEAKNETPPQH